MGKYFLSQTGPLPIDADEPFVAFDLEATGKDPSEARIIQIAAQLYSEEGERLDTMNTLVEPPIRVPEHVRELTGINHQDLKGAPSFGEIAEDVRAFFAGCHLIGYNSKSYDLPLLKSELSRHGLTFPSEIDRLHFDIFQKEKDLQSRSLEDVFHKYTQRSLDGAHEAQTDVNATLEVMIGQVSLYGLSASLSDLVDGGDEYLDSKQRLKRGEDGQLLVCFGKHAEGGPITFQELLQKDRDYARWMFEEIEELRPYLRDEAERLEIA